MRSAETGPSWFCRGALEAEALYLAATRATTRSRGVKGCAQAARCRPARCQSGAEPAEIIESRDDDPETAF